MAQKVSHYQMIKTWYLMSFRLDFFVKLRYESNTIILFVILCVTYTF